MRFTIIIVGLVTLLGLAGCGAPPIVMAAYEGKMTRVESLLASGADVNAKQDGGATALYLAAQEGYTEIVKLLLDKGAEVNTKTDKGLTPLWMSAQEGHTEVVKLLLDKGADVQVKNPADEGTPLSIAAQNGHAEIVALLVDKGADINARLPANDLTPLFIAAQNGHSESVKHLLGKGADTEVCGEDGATALYVALEQDHADAARLLLEHHANPKVKFANTSWTCLHVASKQGYDDIAETLIQAGVDINAKGYKGQTALNFAARYSHRSVFNLLMDSGAEISAVNRMREGAAMTFLLTSEYYEAKGDIRNAIDYLKQAQTKCNELYEDYAARYEIMKEMNEREQLAALLAPIQASLMSYRMSTEQSHYNSYVNIFDQYWVDSLRQRAIRGAETLHGPVVFAQEWRSISDDCTSRIEELSSKLQ